MTVEDGRHRLALPLVIAPRYVPRGETILGVGGLGHAYNTAQVPDAERITPPVRHPDDPQGNPVALTVTLDPGAPLATIESPYHSIRVEQSDGRYEVTLREGAVPADRDFVLEWTTDTGAEPHAALFTQTKTEGTKSDGAYLLAMVSPPSVDVNTGGAAPPREAIFIIDTSGSMHGASMIQAKKALLFALDRLRPKDKFNVIAFSSESTTLFRAARPADVPALAAARGFVGALQAQGGTEIMGALGHALDGRIDASRLRQIVLLTDGAVGNETAILRMVRRRLGDSRLFTVAIGSAPNGYLMRKAAEIGRGSALRIGKPGEVERRMTALFRKLERPVLTNIVARFPDEARTEALPAVIPDLYHGEPIVLTARLPKAEGKLVLTGRLLGRAWRQEVDLSTARPGDGVARLWARRKIESHMDRLHAGGKGDEVRLAVLDLALEHQLLSRYTSLVAVDDRTTRPQDDSLDTRVVSGNAPAGWTPPHQARKRIRHAMAPTGAPVGAPAGAASVGPGGAGPMGSMAYSMRAMPDASQPSYAPSYAPASPAAPPAPVMPDMPVMPQMAMRPTLSAAPTAHVPTVSLGVRTATPAQIMIATGLVLLMLSAGLWWGVRRRTR